MAEQDLRDQVARILLPAAFERLDDGCADREDREEIAGALGTAGDVLSLISSTKEGWRLVPVEPTEAMWIAGLQELPFGPSSPAHATACYGAMIAASPPPPVGQDRGPQWRQAIKHLKRAEWQVDRLGGDVRGVNWDAVCGLMLGEVRAAVAALTKGEADV